MNLTVRADLQASGLLFILFQLRNLAIFQIAYRYLTVAEYVERHMWHVTKGLKKNYSYTWIILVYMLFDFHIK